jgi:hypothetical protein
MSHHKDVRTLWRGGISSWSQDEPSFARGGGRCGGGRCGQKAPDGHTDVDQIDM